MNIDSLAAFKRFLGQPGATLTLTRHDFVTPAHRNYAALFAPRRVAVVKATQVGLVVSGKDEPSWVDLKPASAFRFDGDLVTVDLTGSGTFEKVMIYRVSIAADDEAPAPDEAQCTVG
jgi:hypothetical protein